MVWGGGRLAATLGKYLPTDEPYGESWEISDHPLHRSVVANGPLAGTTLRKLMESRRDEVLGRATSLTTFPLLVKYLDCSDRLSVQVHPDEEAVKRLWPGEGSKTEAWFVLSAAPGSRIYAGLLPGIGEPELRAALAAGSVAECLHSFEPRAADCVFLPAGTVHAVGGGVLMAEVQQTSDATFRLFDWNRRDEHGNQRKLHIDEGLASIHWDQGPVSPIRVGTRDHQSLVHCRYFELEFTRISAAFTCGGHAHPMLILVLEGQGELNAGGTLQPLARGQSWLLPASLGECEVQPHESISVLVCYVL
jgi:mannose-6-phosphate isomerase